MQNKQIWTDGYPSMLYTQWRIYPFFLSGNVVSVPEVTCPSISKKEMEDTEMSEWIRIRIKDFYKDAVGETEYTYVSHEVYEALTDLFRRKRMQRKCGSAPPNIRWIHRR